MNFENEDDDASFDGDLCLHSNVEGLEDVEDNGLEVDVLEEE